MKRLVLLIILLSNLTGLVGCVNKNETNKIENKKQIATEKKIVSKDKLNDNLNSENNIQDITSLIPTGWNILKSAEGDLNKDSIIDKAVVIEKTNKMEFDPPRNLLIFFGNKDGSYTLSIKAKKAILLESEGGPFGDIVVDRGSILLKFFGGSSRWYRNYRFHYQNNGWYLIGATEGGFDNFNGEMFTDEIDYNLITGDYIITTHKERELINIKGNKKKEQPVNLMDFDIDFEVNEDLRKAHFTKPEINSQEKASLKDYNSIVFSIRPPDENSFSRAYVLGAFENQTWLSLDDLNLTVPSHDSIDTKSIDINKKYDFYSKNRFICSSKSKNITSAVSGTYNTKELYLDLIPFTSKENFLIGIEGNQNPLPIKMENSNENKYSIDFNGNDIQDFLIVKKNNIKIDDSDATQLTFTLHIDNEEILISEQSLFYEAESTYDFMLLDLNNDKNLEFIFFSQEAATTTVEVYTLIDNTFHKVLYYVNGD